MTALDARLLAAHEAGNKVALVALYSEAAEGADTIEARSFYLTHAYVFALETGHDATSDLREALVSMGCEAPLHSPASCR